MAKFHTDNGGLAFRSADMKIMAGASTWATRLSNLSQQRGEVHIIMSAITDVAYVQAQIARRPTDISLLIGRSGEGEAKIIAGMFNDILVGIAAEEIRVNAIAIAPNTLFISSEPFGRGKSIDVTLGIRSKAAHDWFLENIFTPTWEKAKKLWK